MTLNETLMQYFSDACDKHSYGFAANIKLLENFDNEKDRRIIGYPLSILTTKCNQYWFECNKDEALRKIFELASQGKFDKISLNKIPGSFFEDIWLMCKNKEEKNSLFSLFSPLIVKEIALEEINNLQDEEFINHFVSILFSKDNPRYSYEDTLTPVLNFFKKGMVKLNEANLDLICERNKYSLRQITYQKLLKEFTEDFLPENSNHFKHYWKKIDAELAGDEFMSEGVCRYFSFNKIKIYNLRSDQNADFFERRLKLLNGFLNKSHSKQITNIERSIFDGVAEMQTNYRFFIVAQEGKLNLSSLIHDLVLQTIKLEDEPTLKSFQTMLNYSVLQQQLVVDENTLIKIHKKNKI